MGRPGRQRRPPARTDRAGDARDDVWPPRPRLSRPARRRAADEARRGERPLLSCREAAAAARRRPRRDRARRRPAGRGRAPRAAAGQGRELVETVHLPFLPSPMGRGFLPDDHPLNMSAARGTAMRGADVVLVLGARLNWMFGMGRGLAPDAKIVQIDIDPAEIGHNREPEVGIVADAGAALRQLNTALEGRAAGLAERRAEGAWLSDLREARGKNEQAVDNLLNSDMTPMTPHRLLKEARDVLPRDAIITVDGQVILATGRQVLQSYTPASRLNSGSNGCMGVGVPFAIGAKLARPRAPVLSANGDCAFGFNGMEIETAVRTGADVVFLVDNNQGIMGGVLEKRMFHEPHPERVAMYTPSARYDKIMEAFGGYSEHVEQPHEVGPALRRAFAAGRPALVDVSVDPNAVWPIPTAGARASALMGY